jgi:hypothetical protein
MPALTTCVQLDAIHALDEVKPAAPLEMESGALKCLRVTTMCASALAYLPSFALSGLQSCSGRKEILVAICPCLDIPGFTSEEESAEVRGWVGSLWCACNILLESGLPEMAGLSMERLQPGTLQHHPLC